MMDYEKKYKDALRQIDIPFGARDSELQEASYHIPEGFHAEIQGDKVVIKKGKNTSWSEGDEKELNDIIKLLPNLPNRHNWLKSLKDRVQPQLLPQQEWSEEDANTLNRISAILVDASEVKNWWKEYRLIERDEMIRLTDFLKSLRPQNRWKPSEIQLARLKEECDKYWEPDGLDTLYTLYQDLKKL